MRWIVIALLSLWSFGAEACVQIVAPDETVTLVGRVSHHKTSKGINSAFPGVVQIDRRGHAYKTVSYTLLTTEKDVCVQLPTLGHEPEFPQVAFQLLYGTGQVLMQGADYVIKGKLKDGNVLMNMTPFVLEVQSFYVLKSYSLTK